MILKFVERKIDALFIYHHKTYIKIIITLFGRFCKWFNISVEKKTIDSTNAGLFLFLCSVLWIIMYNIELLILLNCNHVSLMWNRKYCDCKNYYVSSKFSYTYLFIKLSLIDVVIIMFSITIWHSFLFIFPETVGYSTARIEESTFYFWNYRKVKN